MGDLQVGNEVYALDGSVSVITGFWLKTLDKPVAVYNLEVEDFHSYFVGEIVVYYWQARLVLAGLEAYFATHGVRTAVDNFQNGHYVAGVADLALSGVMFKASYNSLGAARTMVGNSAINSKSVTSVKDLRGAEFEVYLTREIGGSGSFSKGGREFDGGKGNRWWEAKSGNYWNLLEENPKNLVAS